MRKKYKKLALILILVLALISTAYYFFAVHKKDSYDHKAVTEKIENNVTKTANKETVETKPNIDIASLSMPILMYHHIRDYNDENDPIGTNLSVSVNKFQNQLDLIKERGYHTITFEDLKEGNLPEKPIILTFDDGYKNFFDNAYPELKKRDMKAVVYVITGFSTKNEYLKDDDIKQLSKDNFEIGSHTITHPDLTKLTSEKSSKEIFESKQYLENLLDKKVISFCYHSGKYNENIENTVKNAGYDFAVTTVNKLSSFNNSYDLERYRVNGDTNISKFIP